MIKAHYDNIFLVAEQGYRASSHRITKRVGRSRPKEVKFSGNFPSGDGSTYGTLVLNPKEYARWVKGKTVVEGMETAEAAAETLVRTHPDIYYGCPVCDFKAKDIDTARKHIEEHINKFISQFRLEEVK